MNSRKTLLAASLAALALVPVALAQETPKPESPKILEPESRPRESRPEKPPATIQLKVVISDQAGTAAPRKRQLDLRLAEERRFSLRSRVSNAPSEPRLDVDAKASLVADKVMLSLTVEYIEFEGRVEGGPDPRFTNFKFSWNDLCVDAGKSTTIVQTLDPVSDRRVAIEVTPVVSR